MKSEELKRLLDKLEQGTLTEDEQLRLIDWEAQLDETPSLTATLSAEDSEALRQRMWSVIRQKRAAQAPVITMRKRKLWMRVAAAAAVLLFLFISGYLWVNHRPKQDVAKTTTQPVNQLIGDVPPGQYKAKLTLADGRTIILDSATAGKLATQGGTVVVNKDGQLVYQSSAATNEVLYNTLSTGKGETYATVLADGSKVWLNAASSIKFPVAFTDNDRKVEITGEAYFEVKHNDQMPFVVLVNGMEVQDLGTEFNINAYSDEAVIKTTLVSGSIRVVKDSKSKTLSPGEQLQVADNNEMKLVKDANIDLVTAWKNGFTSFKKADIKTLMRQVSRWYDIEVQYEGNIPQRSFSGDISRSANLSELLQLLDANDIHYRLEGRKLTITP